MTVTDDCGNSTLCDTIIVSLTALDDLLGDYIKVFPNPTEGKVFVAFDGLDKDAIVKVNDVRGRLISTKAISRYEQDTATEIDLSGESEGVYIIHIQAGDHNMIRKVILER